MEKKANRSKLRLFCSEIWMEKILNFLFFCFAFERKPLISCKNDKQGNKNIEFLCTFHRLSEVKNQRCEYWLIRDMI